MKKIIMVALGILVLGVACKEVNEGGNVDSVCKKVLTLVFRIIMAVALFPLFALLVLIKTILATVIVTSDK